MRLYDNDAYREEFMELVYELLHDDGTNDRANQIIAAFDSAPEVEAEPLQPNDPLTLEELQEMDGEAVWLQSCCGNMRAIVDRSSNGHVYLRAARDLWDFNLWQKTGLLTVYRRKPEEVTT